MYTKIPISELRREEWLRLRKAGIGGSDAAAVCGLNPYSSPMKVFIDKMTDEITGEDNEAMRQGRDLEDYVAQRFTEATGMKVRRSNYMYRSIAHPFMFADVDRLIVGCDADLECKTASAYNADKWADDNIPIHYYIQCQYYMAVTGKKAWYIAVQLPEISPHILRHTTCCRWAEAGCDIKVLQKLMGHNDIRTTMQVYNHVDAKRLRREVDKMEADKKFFEKVSG